MEDRGVLEKRAFRLDGTRSFVPGLRSLFPEDMWRLVDADPEHLLGRSVWEFALLDTSFEDLREPAYAMPALGAAFEIQGKRSEALQAYAAASSTLGYSEPVLRIDSLGGFAASSEERRLAATIHDQDQAIASVHAALLRQYSKPVPNLAEVEVTKPLHPSGTACSFAMSFSAEG